VSKKARSRASDLIHLLWWRLGFL